MPDSIALVSAYNAATCHFIALVSVYSQILWHCFQFTAKPLARLYFIGFSLQTLLHWFQSTAVPLVRLYFIGFSPDTCQTLFHSFSLQSCCLSDFIFIGFSLQPGHLPDFIALSVYNAATCQTLLHCFQFTAVPVATLYCIGFSLQSCHLSYFIPLVPVDNHTNGQTLFHWSELAVATFVRLYFMISVCSLAACQTLFHWFQFAVLPLVRLYFIGFSLQSCHLPDLIFQVQFATCLSAQRFIIRKVTMLFGYVPWAHDLRHTTLQLCHRPEYTSPGPRCDLTGQNLLQYAQGATCS